MLPHSDMNIENNSRLNENLLSRILSENDLHPIRRSIEELGEDIDYFKVAEKMDMEKIGSKKSTIRK